MLEWGLKLTPDQRENPAHSEEIRGRCQSAEIPPLKLENDPSFHKKITALTLPASQAIVVLLTDEQQKMIPTMLTGMFQEAIAGIPLELFGEVKLSDEQIIKLHSIKLEAPESMEKLPPNTSPTEREARRQMMIQDIHKQAMQLLTRLRKPLWRNMSKNTQQKQSLHRERSLRQAGWSPTRYAMLQRARKISSPPRSHPAAQSASSFDADHSS